MATDKFVITLYKESKKIAQRASKGSTLNRIVSDSRLWKYYFKNAIKKFGDSDPNILLFLNGSSDEFGNDRTEDSYVDINVEQLKDGFIYESNNANIRVATLVHTFSHLMSYNDGMPDPRNEVSFKSKAHSFLDVLALVSNKEFNSDEIKLVEYLVEYVLNTSYSIIFSKENVLKSERKIMKLINSNTYDNETVKLLVSKFLSIASSGDYSEIDDELFKEFTKLCFLYQEAYFLTLTLLLITQLSGLKPDHELNIKIVKNWTNLTKTYKGEYIRLTGYVNTILGSMAGNLGLYGDEISFPESLENKIFAKLASFGKKDDGFWEKLLLSIESARKEPEPITGGKKASEFTDFYKNAFYILGGDEETGSEGILKKWLQFKVLEVQINDKLSFLPARLKALLLK